MFCQNCGNQVKDEALFCNKCGKQIDGNITRQYVRETPVVPIHIPSSKSVSFFGNKFKNTFLGTNDGNMLICDRRIDGDNFNVKFDVYKIRNYC